MQSNVSTTRDHFVFLDYLRVFAAWAVVYDHMFGQWTAQHGVTLRVVTTMRTYIAGPFGIIQDFGWIAVSVFFLISGFVITHVSYREGVIEFLVKRFFRIFPMLAVFVVLAIFISPSLRLHMTPLDFLRNITLINFISAPQVITVGVAWTLIIEVLFYLLTALTMWTRRQDVLIGVNLLIPLITIKFSRDFGNDFFLFAACMAYVPYLVVGQIFYFGLYRRTMGAGGMAIALTACFAVVLYGIMSILTSFLPVTNSYLINFVYACVIFCVFVRLNQKLVASPVIRFLAASSFAVYLVHGTIGFLVFNLVWTLGYHHLAIVAALAATLAGATVVHLVLERPILVAGRRLGSFFRPVSGKAQTPPLTST